MIRVSEPYDLRNLMKFAQKGRTNSRHIFVILRSCGNLIILFDTKFSAK